MGAGCSRELVQLEALLWSSVHWLGEQSTSTPLLSSDPSVVEVKGGVLCTVTGCWDVPGWGFEDRSCPSPQRDLLMESTETRHEHLEEKSPSPINRFIYLTVGNVKLTIEFVVCELSTTPFSGNDSLFRNIEAYYIRRRKNALRLSVCHLPILLSKV